ncbi:MAG: winged helix-turn-helix transcriptional regulator [Desulfobacterales bacterium]|jgi:ArsR family transcriptional regulator, lead/cadmium/zinc/bismuth-responsive transcriptional repressor|nr:winged helix-turn-helix transcriptional regulator [Desulfobacteraceae bacterium]MBT4362867.1 winged helix-turn-helix transcriptional regulator [Desulfobacteraceae bacterium]MBT7086723.1 winged helix-turn-helix transcriptional regulator [Desulfobacterales bacterium]MBT7696551.1 winged helix-turn-helix transcriptional regulator [Desulfobacterales bacterium]
MSSKKLLNEQRNEDICDVRVIHMDKINRARSEEIPEKFLERMTMTYKILGDPTRLRILMALKDNEMCVCDLAAFTGLTESAVSHQLRRLRDLSFVKKRRDGQILYYSIDDKHINELVEVGLTHVSEYFGG